VSTSRLIGEIMKFKFYLQETVKFVVEVEGDNVFSAFDKLEKSIVAGTADQDFQLTETDCTGLEAVNSPYEPLTV